MLPTTLCLLVMVCMGESRRPRAASPQERRAKPGLQLPTAEDLVGALVPSRWKWPRYPEQRPPTLGEWRQGQKPGEWVWRGDRRVFEVKDNRWNPYFGKKPTGLEKKKPKIPSYPKKFLGPKFQKQKRPPVKVRLAPVADLRPKSIDRIDILRPQPQPEVTRNFVPSLNSLNSLKTVQIGERDKNRGREVKKKPAAVQTTTERIVQLKTNVSPKEVDGIQIYMFRGDEGIGGYKQPSVFQQNLILPNTDRTKPVQWSTAEIKSPKVQKVNTTQRTPSPTVSPYRTSPPVTHRDIAPPFPTRHTTTSPNQHNQPIVIIAQSNVAQN